ncbi:hypothetical protein WMF20_31845 [Sorangium sp. So ce834]|uniref:tyrosine-type recombinase/integrase n=1 Tax=Sorangium sp. So ce834 TaxID=3133321 RepID=UPI003F6280E2
MVKREARGERVAPLGPEGLDERCGGVSIEVAQRQVNPLSYRIYDGFLFREGMRADEAGRLEPSELDLERGAVVLDENTTDDPRACALSPDVVRALRAYSAISPPKQRVFIGPSGPLPGRNGAQDFRNHLRRAGIDRPELFETTHSRLNIRLHDTRATFITIKLANGRTETTETWISDRTVHKSSRQIHHDKRAARKVAEIGLGNFAPLDEAIPELNGKGGPSGGGAPTSAGLEAGSPSPSDGASLARALHGQAPGAVDDHAGQPHEATRRLQAARWAAPETRSAANEIKPYQIIDVFFGSPAPSQKSWRDCPAGVNRRDPSLPRGFREGVTTDRTPSGGTGPTRAQWSSPRPGELAATDASRRAAVVALLASTLSRAVALGDEVAVRVVHEAIGRLLGLPAAPEE